MFRRRKSGDSYDEVDGETGIDEVLEAGAEDDTVAEVTSGPWDEQHAPDDGVLRVDFGALRVPFVPHCELRVDADNETHAVLSITIATPDSALQLGAFAAPRTRGIWREVRDEIASSLAAGGGSATEQPGPFGVELAAMVPTDQAGLLAPARFIGVDGPRWFLRGLVTGAAATEPDKGAMLVDAFRQVVVVRGDEAMTVREMLPLRVPREALEAAAEASPQAETPSLNPFARGPEITETR